MGRKRDTVIPVTFCTRWGHGLIFVLFFPRAGSTPQSTSESVSPISGLEGVGRPGVPARLWLKIPSTALLTQHKNVDSRGMAATPTVIKITDSTRLDSSFFFGGFLFFFFYFLWSARSHLPRFIFPLGHAANLQSGSSVFLSSAVPCSRKSIKNKNSSANCITTVHSGCTRTLQRLSFVFFCLFAVGQLTVCVWFRMKVFFSLKPAGLGGSRLPADTDTQTLLSVMYVLTLVVLCHLQSLEHELTLHVSILTLKKKKGKRGVDLKQKLGQANFVLVYTQKHQTNQNNWASQRASFHTFHITLNNDEHCCTLTRPSIWSSLNVWSVHRLTLNFCTVLLTHALKTWIFSWQACDSGHLACMELALADHNYFSGNLTVCARGWTRLFLKCRRCV